MAKNLEELRDELYQSFNRSKELADGYTGTINYPSANDAKAATEAYLAAAKSADSIVKIETELRLRDEARSDIQLPGKRSVGR